MRRALLAALTVLPAACIPEDSNALGFVPLDEVSIAYKDATCRYYVRCGVFPDRDTCLAAQLDVAFAFEPNLEAAIREGRAFYNGDYVDACFEAIATQTCDLTDPAGRVVTPACRHFTRGLLDAGAGCYLDQECVSARCLGGSTGPTCQLGICVGDMGPSFNPAVYNEPCNPVGGCVNTTYCNLEMNLCLMLKLEGMACTRSDECVFGTGCAGNICKTLPTVGDVCPDGMCRDVQEACETSGAEPRCVTVGLAGAACTSNASCAPSFECDLAGGVCVQLPAIGQPCAPSGRCFAEGAFCDASNTCAAVKLDGQPCTLGDECASGLCDAATNLCASAMVCLAP